MAYARTRRICGALVMCGLLVVGCTGGGSGGEAQASADTSAGDGTQPAPSPAAATAPAKRPRTTGQARALIGKVIAGPELFGPGVVRATPYESDPGRWAVLGDSCAWQLREPPADVLATLTRYFEVPAGDGKGSVRLSATVTVHRTALDAAWEQAGVLEEVLDCEEQLLRPGERLTGLSSTAYAWGEGNNSYSDESLGETGLCVSDTRGGPYPYRWDQAALGPVVASTSVCGGRGREAAELWPLVQEALAKMVVRAQAEIGRPKGGA
ncbi:hypothetical protein ACWD1Y_40110 [Streptomyces sp. NPDC002814]